jgi:hypothetical protein
MQIQRWATGVNLSDESPSFNGCDPFAVSVDGHYTGNDGYVVPKTFSEFFAAGLYQKQGGLSAHP